LGRVSGRNRRESEPSIKRLLRRDDDAEVRLAAAVSAGRLRLRSLIPLVHQLYERAENQRHRFRGALALSLFAERYRPKAAELFEAVVNSRPNFAEKVKLVRLVGFFSAPWARSLLRKALDSPNALVRSEARRQLAVEPPAPKELPVAPRPKPAPPREPAPKKKERRPRPDAEAFNGPFPLPPEHERGDAGGCAGCGCRLIVSHGAPMGGSLGWLGAVLALLALVGVRRKKARRARAAGEAQ
jgi:hypothetical protein